MFLFYKQIKSVLIVLVIFDTIYYDNVKLNTLHRLSSVLILKLFFFPLTALYI